VEQVFGQDATNGIVFLGISSSPSVFLDTDTHLFLSSHTVFRLKGRHARLNGKVLWWLEKPPPTMKSSGLCSLKRRGSPGTKALNSTLLLGCQKFTSSNSRSEERYKNQSVSLMATKKRISGQRGFYGN